LESSSFTAAADATDDVPIIPPSLPVRVVEVPGAFIRFFRPLTNEVVVVVPPLPTNDAGMEDDTDATLLERPLMMLSFS
jgi:hypothetical protein